MISTSEREYRERKRKEAHTDDERVGKGRKIKSIESIQAVKKELRGYFLMSLKCMGYCIENGNQLSPSLFRTNQKKIV